MGAAEVARSAAELRSGGEARCGAQVRSQAETRGAVGARGERKPTGGGERPAAGKLPGAGEPVTEVLAPPAVGALIGAQAGIDCDPLAAPVPEGMVCFRGLESLASCFRTADPEVIRHGPHLIDGYLLLMHGPWLDPENAPGSAGAVIECKVPAGVEALWLAGPGDPCTLEGGDMLLLARPVIELTGHRRTAHGVPVVTAEVLQACGGLRVGPRG